MEPIFGFLLFFALAVVIGVIAKKRGRSFWLWSIINLVAAPIVVVVISSAGGGGFEAAIGEFLVPIITLVFVLSTSTSQQLAVETGGHGAYKKCPFCAESVRREAVKCKHCGSTLASK